MRTDSVFSTHNSADKDRPVTMGQLEKVLETSFDAFFMRIEAMVDAKIDAKLEVFYVRIESMVDFKIEQLAIMLQKQFVVIDARFDRIEERLDIVCSEIGRHHIRLLRLERDRGF